MRRILVLFTLFLAAATYAVAAGNDSDSHDIGGPTMDLSDPNDMSQVPRLIRKTLFRAVTKAKRGEHAEAVLLLTVHLTSHPDQDHHLVRYHLARSYDALERYEDARAQYARSVEMEPRLHTGWFGLGHVNYALHDYAGSGSAFLRSFRSSPNPQPETLYFAAAGYMLDEDYATAAPLLDELCRARWGSPRHDWYAQLASCAISLEQPDLAEPLLDAYLADNPGSHEAWFLDCQFHAGFKEYRDAAIALTMVSYLRDLMPSEQRTLGDLYSMVDVPALASERYSASMGDDAAAADYERLASALVEAHDLDRALESLEEGLRARPTSRLWSLLGDIHYLRKDYAAAVTAFAKVVEMDSQRGRPWLMIGYCHIELGNRGLAIQHLVNAAKYNDQADLAGRLLLRARKMDKA